MNKNLIDIGVKVLLTGGIVLLGVLHWRGNDSIVYVDAQKLVANYKGMQVARKEFELKAAIWKANLDTLKQEAELKINEYETKKAKLSIGERKLMEELIQSKQEQFVNYQQVVQEKVQKEDQEVAKKMLDKVNDYIKKFGKENGYKIILAATQYGNIVYAEESRDVTEEVLKGLNSEFK